jgi:hypothetical protein
MAAEAADMAAEVAAALLPVAALRVLSAALLQVSAPAPLQVSVAGAAVSVDGAAMVSTYTADAGFLDAASVAVAVAAEAVGAAELAGYGHPPGAGSTPAGPNLHLQVKNLASRRSKSNKQRLLRKRSDSPRPRVSLGFSIALGLRDIKRC